MGEIIAQLELTYPGSYINLNNQLSHLQEDDTVEDVYEEGDVLTAVKQRHNICRNSVCPLTGGDLVCLMTKDKQPILVESEIQQFKRADFLSTMAVFRCRQTDSGGDLHNIVTPGNNIWTMRRIKVTQEQEETRRRRTENSAERNTIYPQCVTIRTESDLIRCL